uniref:Uncharacterized protein n=1 Tax=Rhabditophanes sp. KR3021 TaxID=114890 RepID=A0AC35TP37_9BILA
MSQNKPPAVPHAKPRLECFSAFYTVSFDGTRQKPIPFPRTSLPNPPKANTPISPYEIHNTSADLDRLASSLAKFNITIEFEVVDE